MHDTGDSQGLTEKKAKKSKTKKSFKSAKTIELSDTEAEMSTDVNEQERVVTSKSGPEQTGAPENGPEPIVTDEDGNLIIEAGNREPERSGGFLSPGRL